MKMKKFELTNETKNNEYGDVLYRIRAVKNFRLITGQMVEEGALGGFVASEENLSHEGGAWVDDEAIVSGNACVSGDALVCGNAAVGGNATICDNAVVGGSTVVVGNTLIADTAFVGGSVVIRGNAVIGGNAKILCCAIVDGDAVIRGNAVIGGNAYVGDHAKVFGACIYDSAKVRCFAIIDGKTRISGDADVRFPTECLCISPFGDYQKPLSFFRRKNGKIGVDYAGNFYSLTAFRAAIKTMDEKYRLAALKAIGAAKVLVNR